MKSIKEMTIGELATFICEHLRRKGFDPVLSGGSVVTIYSRNKYVSLDLDFIERRGLGRKKLQSAMAAAGFQEKNRYFVHPETEYFVEFPPGPLSAGEEPVTDIRSIEYPTGTLRLISPTESVKDRLAAWYHWQDRQSLEQARWVAQINDIDLEEVERWSVHEGKGAEFEAIKTSLARSE